MSAVPLLVVVCRGSPLADGSDENNPESEKIASSPGMSIGMRLSKALSWVQAVQYPVRILI